MEQIKRTKTGRGNQKAVYSTLGNILEMSENELEKKYTAQNAIVAIKCAQEMTKIKLAEVAEARVNVEIEQHRAVVRNSQAKIRNIENKVFDELPE